MPATNRAPDRTVVGGRAIGAADYHRLGDRGAELVQHFCHRVQVGPQPFWGGGVQAEGWTFNKEDHVEFTPDDDDFIKIPNNIIQLKLTENAANMEYDAIRRDGKLYDRAHHTDKWTEDTIECDVIYEFDWVDLPQPIQDFIVARAAVFTSQRIVGDPTQYQTLQQQEAYMRALALEYETQQGQFTFFGHPQGHQNYYQSYQPFHALKR